MGTFGGFTRIRSGYWKGIRTWLLNESVDIPKRVAYLEREIQRIGRITVEYETKSINGNIIATENRIGFSVTPNSSLEKLIKAYIVMGGNPMDISMFMYPNTTKVYGVGADDLGTDTLTIQEFPYDGKVSPIQRKDSESSEYKRTEEDNTGVSYGFGSDTGGSLNVRKYQPPRIAQGARLIWNQEHTIQSAVMHDLRNWANQEIAEKMHLLEHKIIKLCDLEEQMRNELDTLAKAFGASISALFPYYKDEIRDKDEVLENNGSAIPLASADSDNFFDKNLVQHIVYDFDKVFFEQGTDNNIVLVDNVNSMLKVIWAYPDFESESVLDFCL